MLKLQFAMLLISFVAVGCGGGAGAQSGSPTDTRTASITCHTGSDCGNDSVCVSTEDGQGQCAAKVASANDCDGQFLHDESGAVGGVCLASAPGTVTAEAVGQCLCCKCTEFGCNCVRGVCGRPCS